MEDKTGQGLAEGASKDYSRETFGLPPERVKVLKERFREDNYPWIFGHSWPNGSFDKYPKLLEVATNPELFRYDLSPRPDSEPFPLEYPDEDLK